MSMGAILTSCMRLINRIRNRVRTRIRRARMRCIRKSMGNAYMISIIANHMFNLLVGSSTTIPIRARTRSPINDVVHILVAIGILQLLTHSQW